MSDSNQAYISKVHLKGYKSIKDLEIDLLPGLNIIIGPNGSGKTNFITGIVNGFDSDSDNEINYYSNIIFINNLGSKQFLFEPKKSVFEDSDKLNDSIPDLYESLSLMRYRPFYYKFGIIEKIAGIDEIGSINMDSDSKQVNNKFSFKYLEDYDVIKKIADKLRKGRGFTSEELNTYFKPKNQIVESLQNYTPIKGFRVNPEFPFKNTEKKISINFLLFEFYVNNQWHYWNDLSDGTKRLFQIISEVILEPHKCIFIEEPELGIHPNQLQKLMQFLKEQAKEKQIIITTHSPEVLNILGEDELDRIIVTKYDGENGTKMYKLSEKEQTHVRNYMKHQASISDYWIQSGFEKENEEEIAS